MRATMHHRSGHLVMLLLAGTLTAARPQSPLPAAATAQERQAYVVDYYYQARWGHAEEFIRLFRKNHYPVLRRQIESGRLLSVTAVAPRFHATEDRRWDYRVTIVFRNAQVASEPDPNLDGIVRQLYPDQETFRREEQRRFEILVGHWDVPIVTVDLTR